MSAGRRERLISKLLCEQIEQHSNSLGFIVQDVPYLDTRSVLSALAAVMTSTDLRIAVLAEDGDVLAAEAGIPSEKFTSSVQQAERWRNDRQLSASIVVIATRDQPRLSSLLDFTVIGPTQLKSFLVRRAQANPACSNDVLKKWWAKLGTDTNVSLGQLVDYYTALPEEEGQEAEFKSLSSRELPRLGLLSDPQLFDDHHDGAIHKRLGLNREFISRLQTLTEKDRRTIAENIARESDPARRESLHRSHRLLRLLRRGEPAEHLTLAAAQDLFSKRRPQPAAPPAPAPPAAPTTAVRPPAPDGDPSGRSAPPKAEPPTGPTEGPAFATEALLSSDGSQDEDLNAAVADTATKISRTDGGGSTIGTERWEIDLPSGAIVQGEVRREVRDIVTRLVGEGRYGGWIAGDTDGDIEDRIRSYRGEEDLRDEWRSADILRFLSFFEDDHGREVMAKFENMDRARNDIVPLTASLAASPLLVAAAPDTRARLRAYVDSYQELLSSISHAYSELFKEYRQDINEAISHILMLDTITFGEGTSTMAMLTPLHPLYLWRYAEFARVVAAQRDRLSDRDEKLVIDAAQDLPNFLTSLCLPDLTLETPQVLPQVSAIGNLPYFAVRQERSVGHDGIAAVARIVHAFLVAHPPASHGLRLTLLDPPDPGPYLKLLSDLHDQDEIDGAHLTVLYKGRGAGIQSLALDDDEGNVAQLFRSTADDRRFTFEVRSLPADTRQLPADVLAHIVVAFDQSGGRQDAFDAVEHPIQPLAMPQRIAFRVSTQTVDLEPSPGGPFAAYFNVAKLVAKQPPASRLAVRQDGDVRARLRAAAATAPWIVIADRHIDRDLELGCLQVFTAREGAREVVAFADSSDPFRRALRNVIRQYNTAVSDAELDALLSELTSILDGGALTLTPQLDGEVDQNRTKGLLGTLIAARWYKTACAAGHKRLLISLDDKAARRWLHLREDARRADLLGIDYGDDGTCSITVFEVKTMHDTSAEYRLDGDVASGPAIDQLLSTGMLLRDVFNPDRTDELITTPARREVLREHVYRELAKRGHLPEDRKTWAKAAQGLFEGQVPFTIDLHLIEVSIGVDEESLKPTRRATARGADGHGFDLTVTQMNESGVEVLQRVAPPIDQPHRAEPAQETPAPPNADPVGAPPAATPQGALQPDRVTGDALAPVAAPESATAEAVNRPRAYLGEKPGQYGNPVDVWYDPQRPDRPLANGHIAITGETGSGKTQATKAILHDLMAPPASLPSLILDFKDDYSGADYAAAEQLSMFDASMGGLPFNPMAPPVDPTSGRANPMSHVHQLVGILKRIYRLGDQQAYKLREAMKETYSILGIDGKPFVPDPEQTYLPFETIREVLERDGQGPLIGRLSPIFDLALFAGDSTEGTLEDLLDGRSVVRLSQLPGEEVKNAVAEFLLMALYNHLIRRPQPRVLRRLVVLDEAWRLVQSPFLEPLMREGRAFGAGVVIATQYAKDLPDQVSGATATRIFFSQTQVEQVRAVQKGLIGKTSGTDAEHLAALIRAMPPLTCLVQNAHQTPYARTAVRPYYERVIEPTVGEDDRLF